jgi:hypothetical protein
MYLRAKAFLSERVGSVPESIRVGAKTISGFVALYLPEEVRIY